ncbi:permease [Massilia sp. CFBP9012]|uniref:permease n=1 Tax=Massilia sp. CFBP9012 TaxID=3096531 RepID=UPI002A69D2BE|nr:permease [Massilia sp. CFBP9012]MDY0973844.1 permease [Massilia sp. CFBP9012]
MQRALSYAAMPALRVPLPFMLAAPCFALAAALLLVWHGEAALVLRWTPVTLCMTHLVVLGFLTMTIVGSLFQLLPVTAGVAVPLARQVAVFCWCALALGTAVLAAALGLGLGATAFRLAAGLLGSAGFVFLSAIGAAIARPVPAGAKPLVEGVRYAAAALAITIAIGAALALYLGGVGTVNAPLLTDIHATWGLVGWVIVLTATVSFQVIPMFQGTATYPRLLETWLPPLVFALLFGWSAATLFDAAWWALVCETGIGALLLHYAVTTVAWLRGRKGKRKPDTGTRYWLLAMGCLLLAALLHFIPFELVFDSVDALPLLTGVLVIVGCAMSAVNGMLYKIVPFLVWYHLAHDERLPRERIPRMSAVLGEAQAARQWRWHLAGLALLVLACLFPAVLARPAGLFLMVSLLLLARDVAAAALLYVRLRGA